jgi:PiT family inorganic phosphate transporter
MVGAGLAAGIGVHWATIGILAVIWAAAPVVAGLLGYVLTRALDLVPAVRVQAHVTGAVLADVAADASPAGTGVTAKASPGGAAAARPARPYTATAEAPAAPDTAAAADARTTGAPLAVGLIAVGALASFAMGGNDVANATGSLVGTGTFSPLAAGLIGGAGLAVGVLTWGRPLLRKVAFDIVTVDRPMATAAQLVQAAVVLTAVGFGFFTSMNQALIGAMAGTGLARGQQTVQWKQIKGILRGWLIGPLSGLTLAAALELIVRLLTR